MYDHPPRAAGRALALTFPSDSNRTFASTFPDPNPLQALALGLGVPLGWGLHDAAVLATSSQPEAALLLVPGVGTAALCSIFVALVLSRARWLAAVLFVVLAAVAVSPASFGFTGSPARELLSDSLLLAFFALLCAALLHHRWSVPSPCAGVAAGILAAVAQTLVRNGYELVSLPLAGAALLLPLAGSSRLWLQALATLAAIAVPVVLIGREVRAKLELPRPDLPPPSARAAPDTPSAILIVLDTVRADHMGMYGYERDTTPRLDALARDVATRYDNARSTSSWTLPSHASLFTGLFPSEHGMTHPRHDKEAHDDSESKWGAPYPLRADARTIAERLRALGYRTAAIVANNMMGSWAGLDRGFERYDDRKSAFVPDYQAFAQVGGRRELIGHKPYRDAGQITDLALKWLDEERGSDPFFLMLNYMDAHGPYVPPPPFDQAFGDQQPENPLRPRDFELFSLLYDRELAYLDSELGRLFEELEERGLRDGVLWVVTSDHGEAFGEHDTWIHDWTLYDELVRVPLLVKPAAGRTSAVVGELTRGTDVHDLILDELGVERDTPAADDGLGAGASGLQAMPGLPGLIGEWYYTEALSPPDGLPHASEDEMARDLLAWFEGDRKVIVSSTGVVEAFDVVRDPGEERPLALEPEEIAAALERARGWWEAHPPPAKAGRVADDETLERLGELGYATGDER